MICIDVNKVLHEASVKKELIIEIIVDDNPEEQSEEIQEITIDNSEREEIDLKSALMADLDQQHRDIYIERCKLSNKYMPMIDEGASQSMLASHYEKIESFTRELQQIFITRRFVEQNGRLPSQKTANDIVDNTNLYALKDRKRKLSDKKCKLAAKLKVNTAKGVKNIEKWSIELDKAIAEYDMVCKKIEELRHE